MLTLQITSAELFLPALILMIITMLVWFNLFVRRLVATKKSHIDPQDLATPDQVNAAFDARTQAPSNCFKNLFELPVIFYGLVVLISISNLVDSTFISLSWAFVGLRAVQAAVHCTYNKVLHRFIAYMAASCVLWGILIRFSLNFM